MGTQAENRWSPNSLQSAWNSQFSVDLYKNHNDDLDIQTFFLLLERTSEKALQIGDRCSNWKSSCERALSELQEKEQECAALKQKVRRLSVCEKCTALEVHLQEAKRKAVEAQNRMDSIARILLQGNSDSPFHDRTASAIDLVSQMLLGNSPKRKKKCFGRNTVSTRREEILAQCTVDGLTEKSVAAGDVIPETMGPPTSPLVKKTRTPIKARVGTNEHKSPSPFSPEDNKKNIKCISANFPPKSSNSPSAKKNLSADFVQAKSKDERNEDIIDESPKKKLSFHINGPPPLDATLLEYVREGNSEMEKIWFNDSPPKAVHPKNDVLTVIEETPENKEKKRHKHSSWLMKEKPGVTREVSSRGNRLKQLKLTIKSKPKEEKVSDISTLDGFNGGLPNEEEDIIANSPNSSLKDSGINLKVTADESTNRTLFKPLSTSTQMDKGVDRDRSTVVPKEPDTQDTVNTTLFKPEATSTQKERKLERKLETSFDRVPNRDEPEDVPNFMYKRGVVRKREERKRLGGWDCDECEKYYGKLGLSPSKLKDRMNACSKHRDHFQPQRNATPPGFWNPLFPDTEECKERGMYLSIHCPKKSDG